MSAHYDNSYGAMSYDLSPISKAALYCFMCEVSSDPIGMRLPNTVCSASKEGEEGVDLDDCRTI